MTIGKPSQPADLNEKSRQIWEQNAIFWDDKIGDDGNDFHRLLIAPANERLLNLQPGETVLEIACGNGVFARRMVARHGVHVVATEQPPSMLMYFTFFLACLVYNSIIIDILHTS